MRFPVRLIAPALIASVCAIPSLVNADNPQQGQEDEYLINKHYPKTYPGAQDENAAQPDPKVYRAYPGEDKRVIEGKERGELEADRNYAEKSRFVKNRDRVEGKLKNLFKK